jgi:hypothetical protein
MLIDPVPEQFFSGLGRVVTDDPARRNLRSILNELIDGVNAAAVVGVDHLRAAIDPTAWAVGWVALGTCPAGRMAHCCVVEVLTPFDGGAQLTVGDVAAQGRLQAAAGSNLWAPHLYVSYPHHLYVADEALYVYCPVGAPSTGAGQVTVYLS